MWKVLFFIFLIFFDTNWAFESSRLDGINPNFRDDIKAREETEEEVDYVNDNDDNFDQTKLIGRWRNNGDAIEPKWRDGDSVPLIPFDAVKDGSIRQRTFFNDENQTDNPRRVRQRIRKLRPIVLKRMSTNEEQKQEKDKEYRGSFQVHPNEYELSDEEYQKPRPRKRRPPQNSDYSFYRTTTPEYETETSQTIYPSKRNRDKENSELKSILKMQQSEGLSLSEILQQRNLSLSDLLKGKSSILNVLKSQDEENVNEKVIPQSREKNINKNVLERPKWMSSQTKRDEFVEVVTEKIDEGKFSIENEDLSTLVRLTKPIILPRMSTFTEKPLVVETTITTITTDPVKLHYKDNLKTMTTIRSRETDEIMEFSDFIKKENDNTTKIYLDNSTNVLQNNISDKYIDSTLSIEQILSITESPVSILTTTNEVIRKMDNSYNLDEFIEKNFFDPGEMEYQNDGTSITNNDHEEMITEEEPYDQEDTKTTTEEPAPTNHRGLFPNNKIYEQIISEIEPEAREEILELISSGKSAEMLQRLLKSRNMSLDELISLRQRGSSRVHLAQMSSARIAGSRAHRLKQNNDQVLLLNYTMTTPKTEDQKPIIIDLSPRIDQNIKKNTFKNFDTESLELMEILNAFDSLPFAIDKKMLKEKKIKESPNNENNFEDNLEKDQEAEKSDIVEENLLDVDASFETTTIGETTTEIYQDDIENFEDDKQKTLAKVRPSIVASGAILGMTIVGFLAIFIICRIRRKQQKYMYRNAFARGVFQAPMMNARKLSNSSSLNTIMVNVVSTSTAKRPYKREMQETNHSFNDDYDCKSDIDNDSLDANDSWDTIPDFMK